MVTADRTALATAAETCVGVYDHDSAFTSAQYPPWSRLIGTPSVGQIRSIGADAGDLHVRGLCESPFVMLV